MNLLYFALYLIAYFIFHSFLAHQKVKSFLIDRIIPTRFYRLIFNFLAVVLLIPLAVLYQQINSNLLFDIPLLKNLGIGILLLGIILLLFALNQYNLSEFIGTQQLKQQAKEQQIHLKTSGFNSIVRHPLYFSSLLILWGFFLFRPTELILTMTIIATAYLYFGTKLEEEKLVEEFKHNYTIYQKEVPMLLPWKGLRKNKKGLN